MEDAKKAKDASDQQNQKGILKKEVDAFKKDQSNLNKVAQQLTDEAEACYLLAEKKDSKANACKGNALKRKAKEKVQEAEEVQKK